MLLSFISKGLKCGQWLKIKVEIWNVVDSAEMCSRVIILVKKERLFVAVDQRHYFTINTSWTSECLLLSCTLKFTCWTFGKLETKSFCPPDVASWALCILNMCLTNNNNR